MQADEFEQLTIVIGIAWSTDHLGGSPTTPTVTVTTTVSPR